MKKHVSVLGRDRSILGISVLNGHIEERSPDEESDVAAPVSPPLALWN